MGAPGSPTIASYLPSPNRERSLIPIEVNRDELYFASSKIWAFPPLSPRLACNGGAEDNGEEATVTQSQSVVLIVDDDSNIRNFVSLMIQQRGYSLLAAADGQEALTLSRTYPGEIDLVVSDVNMPRMNGLDLAGQLLDERPGIRVLMMSGIEQTTLGLPFLHKPFLPDQLWRKLDEVLTGGPKDSRESLQLEGAASPAGHWVD